MVLTAPARVVLPAVVAALAATTSCSGGGSSTAAGSSTSPAPTTPATSPTATAATTGRLPITTAAARRLMTRYAVLNNRANHALSLTGLGRLDAQATLAEDQGYTRSGRVTGQRPTAFWTVPQQIAITRPAASSGAGLASAGTYFVATSLTSTKPPVAGKAQGKTAPGVDVFAKTASGWRHVASVNVGTASNTALPQLATDADGTAPAAGSSASAQRATQLVDATLSACASGHQPTLVTAPASCGELDVVRQVPTFHVTATLAATRWPTYTVALSGGRTLVVGSRELTVRVRATGGVQWTQPTIVSGLLGIKSTPPRVAHGYVERSVFTVALVVPAGSGRATTLGVGSAPVAAHRLVPQSALTQV